MTQINILHSMSTLALITCEDVYLLCMLVLGWLMVEVNAN